MESTVTTGEGKAAFPPAGEGTCRGRLLSSFLSHPGRLSPTPTAAGLGR
jgi:hypothetical protein